MKVFQAEGSVEAAACSHPSGVPVGRQRLARAELPAGSSRSRSVISRNSGHHGEASS